LLPTGGKGKKAAAASRAPAYRGKYAEAEESDSDLYSEDEKVVRKAVRKQAVAKAAAAELVVADFYSIEKVVLHKDAFKSARPPPSPGAAPPPVAEEEDFDGEAAAAAAAAADGVQQQQGAGEGQGAEGNPPLAPYGWDFEPARCVALSLSLSLSFSLSLASVLFFLSLF
jgi:hypothetical protein